MRYATCHPDRQHQAKGLCHACYNKARPPMTVEQRAKEKARKNAWRTSEKGRAQSRAWRQANREWLSAQDKARRLASPEKSRAAGAKWRKANKAQIRAGALLYRYGITQAQFESMWQAQEGRCRLCQTELPPKGKRTVVDHCHSSGRVRGILCLVCNVFLGALEKRGMGLLDMFRYLGWL